jgi:hypothetical protein
MVFVALVALMFWKLLPCQAVIGNGAFGEF